MQELTHESTARVGVDLAKNVIQIHGENDHGRVLWAKAVSRDRFVGWCISHLPAGCTIAMEACSGAHHWARQLRAKGFVPMILPAHLVEPFRRQGKRGKNDANDAAAVWEASGRPRIHPVPVKTPQQQALLALHRLREAFKGDRTAIINTIRGLLGEYGVVFPQGPEALRLRLSDALEDTKRGDTYLRTLLVQAAKSAVMTAHKRSDPISQWVARLKERAGWQKAVVALANKHARIVWAMLVRGRGFDAAHVNQWSAALPGQPAAS
jgi:transposase